MPSQAQRLRQAWAQVPVRTLRCVVTRYQQTHILPCSYTLEWMQPNPGSTTWVGVHSARANHYVAAMLNHGLLQPLLGLPTHVEVRREVPYGARSRVDFVLQQPHCSTYVEVKSVTMTQQQQQDDGGDAHVATVAVFPDTVSTRAQQHARELTALVNAPGTGEDGVQQGKRRRVEATTRAVMLFVVQRDDAQAFEPCRAKDPEYAALCEAAAAAGVKLVAVAVRLDEQGGVAWVGQLPIKTVLHQGESLTSS